MGLHLLLGELASEALDHPLLVRQLERLIRAHTPRGADPAYFQELLELLREERDDLEEIADDARSRRS